MLVATSSFGSRAVVIGVSALMHVAAFAVAGRGTAHGGDLADPNATPVDVSTVDIQLDSQIVDAPAHEHPHHTHTHSYPVSPDHDLVDHDPSIVHTPYAAHDHDQAGHDHHEEAAPAMAPDVLTAPADAPTPKFTITLGSAPTSHGAVTQNGASISTGGNAQSEEAPVLEDSVTSRASLLTGGVPSYPADARAAELEADVPLEIIVDAAGTVKMARSLAPVGYGLDEAAVTAVRRYRFSPAERSGRPVAVRMRWVVQFRLK